MIYCHACILFSSTHSLIVCWFSQFIQITLCLRNFLLKNSKNINCPVGGDSVQEYLLALPHSSTLSTIAGERVEESLLKGHRFLWWSVFVALIQWMSGTLLRLSHPFEHPTLGSRLIVQWDFIFYARELKTGHTALKTNAYVGSTDH